jgi:hypothetical protein
MQKIKVTSDELHDAILETRRVVSSSFASVSRSSEGKYQDTDDLPPLLLPGGDIGDLGIILAASNTYGFKVNNDKVWELIQTYQNDFVKHDLKNTYPHVKELVGNPAAFQLSEDSVKHITSLLPKGNEEFTTDHINGAVILIKGMYALPSQLSINSDFGKKRISPFAFHYTLVNQRHRVIAHDLIEKNIVELFPGQDEEYLYEVISDMTDIHLFESIGRTAPNLPIYKVEFDKDSNFIIEDLSATLMSIVE